MSDYVLGCTVLGANIEIADPNPPTYEILGADTWDVSRSFDTGDVVRYWGQYWRAVRPVSSPLFPMFQSGEVPGKSDAWVALTGTQSLDVSGWGEPVVIDDADWGKPVVMDDVDWGKPVVVQGGGGHGGGGHGGGGHGGHGHGGGGFRGGPGWWGGWGGPAYYYDDWDVDLETEEVRCVKYAPDGTCLEYRPVDILGLETVLGMIDIGQAQLKMNGLKPVTVGVARSLLRGGQAAISGAISGAKQPWYKSDLPGDTARKDVQGHLQWHADNLNKFKDANAAYPSASDIQKWTMQAFVEANAVEEGAAYLDQIWNQMWTEIAQNLAAIPKIVAQKLAEAASGVVEGVTGLPLWGWGLIITGVVGVLGFTAWKLANSRVGLAAIGGYAGRR